MKTNKNQSIIQDTSRTYHTQRVLDIVLSRVSWIVPLRGAVNSVNPCGNHRLQ